MDSLFSLQDVIRCHLCETPVPSKVCDTCQVHLCEACKEEHVLEESKEHEMVSFKMWKPTLNCPKHSTQMCGLHCEQCNIPLCTLCAVSSEHELHDKEDILKTLASKKTLMQKDLRELETSIYPIYQEAASNIPVQRANIIKHSQKLTTALNKQGEILHNEIVTLIHEMQSGIDELDSKHLEAIDKQEDSINHSTSEIYQAILDLRMLLDSNDVCLVSEYESKSGKFRKPPLKLAFSFRNFQPKKVNRQKLLKQFGTFTDIESETEEEDLTLQFLESSPLNRPLLDVPHILADISTGQTPLYGVSCLSDEKIWTRGNDSIMKLYNLKGELVRSVRTQSGKIPWDIAVTLSGGLVYTDYWNRSVDLVSNTQIDPLVKLWGWRPRCVCNTSFGDLLVLMDSDDYKQTKVVRYFGPTEKQSIQWNDQGQPLFSSDSFTKYLSENRNLDICVSDCAARAIVVVSAAGKFRFRYTGPPSTCTTEGSISPLGIATDSQGKILTADSNNDRIHILDQDGHFLRFIDNCGLHDPRGLCVDSRDNLIVAETCKLKKIQYYM